jgi:hypothetical protein
MASPGAYASPLRENQVGLFGDGATHPPTPPTNVRVLIAQKEKVRPVGCVLARDANATGVTSVSKSTDRPQRSETTFS